MRAFFEALGKCIVSRTFLPWPKTAASMDPAGSQNRSATSQLWHCFFSFASAFYKRMQKVFIQGPSNMLSCAEVKSLML